MTLCAITDPEGHVGGGDLVAVTFSVDVRSDIETISLVGDFNEWSTTTTPMRRTGNHFTVTIELAPGRYRYQYLVDGERWENDWAADEYEETPAGAYVSVIELPRATPRRPQPAGAEPAVSTTRTWCGLNRSLEGNAPNRCISLHRSVDAPRTRGDGPSLHLQSSATVAAPKPDPSTRQPYRRALLSRRHVGRAAVVGQLVRQVFPRWRVFAGSAGAGGHTRFGRPEIRELPNVTHVLIAVDETEASVHAAEVARGLFGDDADYSAVSVANIDLQPDSLPWWGSAWGSTYPVPYGAAWPLPGMVERDVPSARQPGQEGDVPPADAAIRAASDTAEHVVEQTGLTTAEPIGEIGNPADAILRAAEERHADVIVVGSHDHSWFDRLFGSSVEKQLLKNSDIPVLVA